MEIRNIAIIAHVDHGKTTLVDALLRQSQTKLGKEFTDSSSLIMDSNDLEKERGITIFSKNASVIYGDTKINIIDTPGHADFGGEVERVLKMADGCLLLVDAKEGPMPQTRFVLKQALKMGLKVIVVINKVDKATLRSSDGDLKIDKPMLDRVINKTFDLFLELGADESSAYFPIIYASGKQGLAGLEPDLTKMTDIKPIFEAILKEVPPPSGDPDQPLQMLVMTLAYDNFKGRIATGRIYNGRISAGQDVMYINRQGRHKKCRITILLTFVGLDKVETEAAMAGDIVSICGIPDITIGETITDTLHPMPLPLLTIEEPTVRMTFGVNTSPFAGREGQFKTSRQIQERLFKELETDVALRVENRDGGWMVSGRGELHLAIFIERLRREGFEFEVSRPQVIEKEVEGKILTPFERVYIEVPDEFSGIVMKKMGERHANLQNMSSDNGTTELEFIISTKEFFGLRSEFLTDTKGLGIINTIFHEYAPDTTGEFTRDRGSLVVHENGITKLYGLTQVQDRGTLFIGPGQTVYKGQIIGQNARPGDMSVNVCKEKQQTNMRSQGEGVSEHFNTPKLMSLENSLEYIDETELVEVTPKNIRLRKVNLTGTR